MAEIDLSVGNILKLNTKAQLQNEDLEGALQEYLRLMDAGAYFEAHEVLEEAWHPLRLRKDPLANLVKGLINAAICFEHIQRQREGYALRARKVMASYERHKGLCQEGIVLYPLFKKACQSVEDLQRKYEEVWSMAL
jgi:predicted metal-dependent hydrolase